MKSNILLILVLVITIVFPTQVQGYVWGNTQDVITESNYGVTLDFPMWSGAITYFESFDFVQQVEVSYGEYSFMGTTSVWFAPNLEPNDYVLLNYELAMLSRAYHNDLANFWWGFVFPVEQTYYLNPDGTTSVCKPHFAPQLGYKVLRCSP